MPLGIRTLVDLAYDEQVHLIAPGGDVRPGELVVTGDLAEVAFDRLRFDTFVLGACGVDARSGITTHVPADARVKRAAVASSARTLTAPLLADHLTRHHDAVEFLGAHETGG